MHSLEGKVLYPTRAGVELIIYPPTLTVRNAVMLEAMRRYPLPDPASYSKPTGTATLSGGTAMTDGRESADFKNDTALAKLMQREYLETGLLDACVDARHGREVLMDSYSEQIARLRNYTKSIPDNDWEAVLKTFIVEADELNNLRRILSRNLPLTEEETAEGRKFFRVDVPGDGLRDVHPGGRPPDPQPAQPRQDKRPDGGSRSGAGVGPRSRSKQ